MAIEGAACIGADPKLFNATSGDEAEDALTYCDRCPVTQECEDLIRPRRSLYDGVAAGKVWHNGVPVNPVLFA